MPVSLRVNAAVFVIAWRHYVPLRPSEWNVGLHFSCLKHVTASSCMLGVLLFCGSLRCFTSTGLLGIAQSSCFNVCLQLYNYGLGLNRVDSLSFLSCCPNTWFPGRTSEYLAPLSVSACISLLLSFCSLSVLHTPCLICTSLSSRIFFVFFI